MPMPVDGTLCLSETDHFLWCKYQGVEYPHGFKRGELVQMKDPRSGEWRKPVLLMRYLDSNDMRPLVEWTDNENDAVISREIIARPWTSEWG